MALPKRTVWVNVVPPNIIGVWSTEEKADEQRSELDDATYSKCDTWNWEIDGECLDEEL